MEPAKDPAVLEMKRILESKTIMGRTCTLVYANLSEANFNLDNLEIEESAAVFVFVAKDKAKNSTNEAGLIIRDITVIGMMLRQMDSATNDYSAEAADPYVHDMYTVLNKFIFELNKSPRTMKETPIEEWTSDKVHGKFDRHLFGVGTQFNWKFNTMSRGCH